MSVPAQPTVPPGPVEPSVLWTSATAYSRMDEPPIAAGDRLIVVANGTVFAISSHDGTPAGTTDTVATQNFPYTMTSWTGGLAHPLASGGNLYFADGPAIVALRLADGAPLAGWKAPAVASVNAIVAAGGQVVVSALDAAGAATVFAFNAADGTAAFGPVTISQSSPGPVGVGDGALFFVAGGQPHAVNVDFGDDRWAAHPPSVADAGPLDLIVAPLVVGNTAVFAAQDLVALETRTGAERWRCAPSSTSATWLAPAADASGSTMVAVNTAGDVFGIALSTGTVRWHGTCPEPFAPTVVGGTVYIPENNGTTLTVRNVGDGTVTAIYSLPEAVRNSPPLVIDGSAFMVTAEQQIVARGFGEQSAAWFDGSSSHIEVDPDGGQFDTGLGDFTVEAWFSSTVGGEILSSHPTQAIGHGLRLNLTPDGQLRVAVLDPAGSVYNVARTGVTNATDGAWHHVAFSRAAGVFSVALDGLNVTLNTLPQPAAPLPLDGGNGLTVGALRSSAAQTPGTHFGGLLHEIRFWDMALDLATIQTNLKTELTGAEPHLKGLWRLDGPASQTPVNAVAAISTPHSSPTRRLKSPRSRWTARRSRTSSTRWSSSGRTPGRGARAARIRCPRPGPRSRPAPSRSRQTTRSTRCARTTADGCGRSTSARAPRRRWPAAGRSSSSPARNR